jgi:hypothetical protein
MGQGRHSDRPPSGEGRAEQMSYFERLGLIVVGVSATFGCGSEANTPARPGGGTDPFGTAGTSTGSGGGGTVTPPPGSGGMPVTPSNNGGTTQVTPPGKGGAISTPTGGSGNPSGGSQNIGGGINPAGGSPNGGAAGGGTGETGGAAGSVGQGGSAGGGPPPPHGACLDGVTDFGKAGPFMTTSKAAGAVKFTVPTVPAGCKVPIVHLSNGTGATCSAYQPILTRLATHGFLAACYENTNTGAGDYGIQAYDAAMMTFPDLYDKKIGSTGHSQGGQASYVVLAKAEKKYGKDFIYAGLAMEPASGFGSQPSPSWQTYYGQITSPMFMFSGLGTDGLVSQGWVQQAYDAMSKTVEKYFWTANGATHVPVPNDLTMEVAIPWFRWKLLGDQKACAAFKALPMTHNVWVQVAAANAQNCQ